jgi:hypothetical protein
MVRDMGKTFAACPNAHATLEEIRVEMVKGEGSELEVRGMSKTQYAEFWAKAFAEGQASPDPPKECDERLVLWRLMLKNIREE